jgi:hypothetical protein
MHYRQLCQDSLSNEVIIDPHGAMGLMIADQAPSDSLDPLELLIEAEAQLQAEFGLTFLQAVHEYRRSQSN